MSLERLDALRTNIPNATPALARILVVEDNQVNQKVVTAVLRKRGYSIEMANNGREALSKLAEASDFDLILMDVQMPVLDGLEATRLIRKDQRWKTLPIVAMTAHPTRARPRDYLTCGPLSKRLNLGTSSGSP